MLVLGAMSGSSLDGLDLAIIDFSEDPKGSVQWSLKHATTLHYPDDIIQSLSMAPALSARKLYHLEADFSKLSAAYIANFIEDGDLSPELIGWHGHTVFHDPDRQATLQIGHGSQIAALTGLPTIGQFRLLDMALGGQGAPLAPLVEIDLLPRDTYFTNLGGICNVSKHSISVQSSDVVACNQILNRLAARNGLDYDNEGGLARKGQIIPDLLDRLQQIKYHQEPSPKSMDNSWILDTVWPLVESEPDTESALRTVVEYIAKELKHFVQMLGGDLGGTMVLSGGGAYNTFLVERIVNELQPLHIDVRVAEAHLIEFKEAILMAYMAYCFVSGRRNVVSSVTGSRKDHVGGSLFQGSKPFSFHA